MQRRRNLCENGKAMSIVAKRLDANNRAVLAEHFIALPAEDIRLRFGIPRTAASLRNYVADIDFNRDAVFGVFERDLSLAGVAHLAIGDDCAELGVSVRPADRGMGIGSALFERAHAHA